MITKNYNLTQINHFLQNYSQFGLQIFPANGE